MEYNQSNAIVVERIKSWMKENSFNQQDVAIKMGISDSLVGAMLRGERRIPPARIQLFAEMMKISVRELVERPATDTETVVKLRGKATSRKSRSAIRDIVAMCEHYVELKGLLETNKK
ncbi:helix-turn-helix domain-containing protein [Mesobacillus stamsii]|uniref:Transcriptional regulator with XRE-family HTH domain n=1 Tax=Mesobacillus stamsii TaxID=225347 RepID=A0ABU0FTV9_9BACI|nr:helix-turn-helix transcriptional regulator [Mesobacillus stamsii]MDQ0413021.1 transcriptional regulator with XRE-family HTH domain [Mesobacillus stamsii]